MSFPNKGFSHNNGRLTSTNKTMTLNPNAAEFIPLAQRLTIANAKGDYPSTFGVPGASERTTLDLSGSNVPNDAANESPEYCHWQLPDDITAKFMEEDRLHSPRKPAVTSLSISDRLGNPLSSLDTSQLIGAKHDISSDGIDNFSMRKKVGFLSPIYNEEQLSTSSMTLATENNSKLLVNGDHHDRSSAAFMALATKNQSKLSLNNYGHHVTGRKGVHYSGNSIPASSDLMVHHPLSEDTMTRNLEVLVSKYPDFAAEIISNAYIANEYDLNSTIKSLTHLEVLYNGTFGKHLNQNASVTSRLRNDFPTIPVSNFQNAPPKYTGENFDQPPIESPGRISQGPNDLAAICEKLALQDSSHWNYESNGLEGNAGSSRHVQLSPSSYNDCLKLGHTDKFNDTFKVEAASMRHETGEAVASMSSNLRKVPVDLANLAEAYFDKARQAYLIGNRALTKDLSQKGQQCLQMKAAQDRANETARWRKSGAPELENYIQGQAPTIDLHGLPVNEALQVLKHDLSILKRSATTAGRGLQAYVYCGTGDEMKGTRTSAGLLYTVLRHLDEEKFYYHEHRAGLLRVVIY
ncbi:hypothetical protein J5N97_002155 [Dioscorea zingiberensis]|uniref:Smr domain-containing protein n=1 Tax=Dioscorea zingiberensis TaxID=325984 RepID=A0A9D5D396_9LILI|nr:hypothetical protein J5N97_002155 [Dioscorea zingiberensis]